MKNSVMKLFLLFLTSFPAADADDAGFFKFGYSCLCVMSGKKPSSTLRISGINAGGKGSHTIDDTKVNGFSGEWSESVRLTLTTGKKITFTIKVRGTYSAMVTITNPSTKYDLGRTYEFKLETMLKQLVSPCPNPLDMEPSCAGKEAMFRLKKIKEIEPTKHTFAFGFTCICAPDEATDPYAVVYVLDTKGKQEGKAVLKTETVDNTVVGQWKKTLTFLYDENKNQSFKIEVWDDDGGTFVNPDDKLGSVTVPIATIVKERYTVNSLSPREGQLAKCPKSYTFSPDTYIGICEGKLMPIVSVKDRTPPPS